MITALDEQRDIDPQAVILLPGRRRNAKVLSASSESPKPAIVTTTLATESESPALRRPAFQWWRGPDTRVSSNRFRNCASPRRALARRRSALLRSFRDRRVSSTQINPDLRRSWVQIGGPAPTFGFLTRRPPERVPKVTVTTGDLGRLWVGF